MRTHARPHRNDGMNRKTCRRCGHPKPLSEFKPHDRSRDGLEGHCRACKPFALVPAWTDGDPVPVLACSVCGAEPSAASFGAWHVGAEIAQEAA